MNTSTLLEMMGISRSYQWLYRIDGSPLWEVSPFLMTKSKFVEFVESYNLCHRQKIVEYRKAKPTRRDNVNEEKI